MHSTESSMLVYCDIHVCQRFYDYNEGQGRLCRF